MRVRTLLVVSCPLLWWAAACAVPQSSHAPEALLLEPSGQATVEFELPHQVAHWRGPLLDDLQQLEALLDQELPNWPRVRAVTSLRLVCTTQGAEAMQYAVLHGLTGDPQVPRTHRRQRVAVIPLPRIDRLMTTRSLPPRTIRETIRHELVHLLCLDRPGLADAPVWFHEGLAEAWVGLRRVDYPERSSHALGLTWLLQLRELTATQGDQSLHQVTHQLPAEVRYQVWAALVLQLLRTSQTSEPWTASQAQPTLSQFLEHFRELANPQQPILYGRDADFFAGGKSALLVSPPQQSVAVQLANWDGSRPYRVRARTGRSGATLGEVVFSAAATNMCLRVRQNQDGAWAAAWELHTPIPRRALADRLPGAQTRRWREWTVQTRDLANGQVRLTGVSGDARYSVDLPPQFAPSTEHPWTVRAQVTDGAFELASDAPLLPALR